MGKDGARGFDGCSGIGVVELIRKDMPPAVLRVDLAKESITPKETKKAPSIGAIGSNMASMGGVMAGAPMNMGAPTNSAFAEAADDMPF